MMRKQVFIAALLALALLAAAPARAAEGLGVVRDEEIEQTLRLFSRPIFEQAGLSPENVGFILIDRNELNAFVAGGQNIFVFTGLLLKTGTPEELTGVIAHETGHIAHGDLIRIKAEMKELSFQAMAATLLGIVAAAGSGNGEVGAAVASAAGTIAERTLLRHSRMQETAADQAGVAYLKGARLPVDGMLSFMKKLESQELLPESQQVEYVRTHPLTQNRISYLAGVVEQQAGKAPAAPPEWKDLHARMVAKLLGFLFPDQALLDKGEGVPARYGRAIALYRKGKIDDALEALAPLIKAEPKNPWFHELKGQMLFEHGRIEEALPAYAAAVLHAPGSGLIRTAYGHALLESKQETKKRQAEAVKQLERAQQAEPRNAQTRHFLAIAYGKQGQEGQSRLSLAEEAMLLNKPGNAIREAQLAQASLPRNSASWLRASDILDAARRAKKDKKGD